MKITIRKVLRVFAWVTAIFIALWLLVWGYVIINKKSLLAKVNAELATKVRGEIKIGDLEPSLLSTFPNISIRLSQVLVRDSMWKFHQHDLLKAEKVFVRLGLFSLFTGSPEIKKVIIENGSVFIFSDSSGYSNEYMFQSKKPGGKAATGSTSTIPDIELKKVVLNIDFKDRNKLYQFDVAQLNCDVDQNGNSLKINIKTNLLVNKLAFNTERGSFLTGKTVSGRFNLGFNLDSKTLAFKNVSLKLDDHPFNFTGNFNFSSAPALYYLDIKTEKIFLKQASLLLTENLTRRLDSFTVEKPLDVNAIINGRTIPNKMPLVNITARIENNNITLPLGSFTDVSFMGHFNNQVIKSEKLSDENSGLFFTDCSGKWENILLKSDTIKIVNLKDPVMDADIKTSFQLTELNDVLGSSMEFINGNCNADVRYHGIIMKSDTAAASIFGKINLEKASLRYIPRNLVFTNSSGSLVFDDKDFYVKQLKTQIGNTDLLMNGAVKNLTSLIDKSPEKLLLNWNIASSKINLSDFTSFLSKRSAAISKKAASKKMLKLAYKIDRMLNDCNVDLQLKADHLIYKKFVADKIAANLQLTNKMLALKNVLIEHAGGTLVLNGSMIEGADQNQISLSSNITNVDVTKIFTAFNNFGQDGIMDKNLKGRLSANINLTGAINSKAEMDANSLKGMVDLRLQDGALINFEPVMKISETAFKSRDFSNIRFADLKDKLEINGSEIKVNRMEIQSTVFTMFVEGIYDVKKGTDLGIQIPLSNLSKRGEDFELKNKGVNSKTGVSVNLRARTGNDGKAKISWDPFKLALKKNNKADNAVADSTRSTFRK